jgi:hypothetical protein
MNKAVLLAIATSLLALVTLACGATASPTPALQATVDAAVAATGTAQARSVTAQPLAPTPTVTPTVAAQYVTMTEAELAALIDQTVTQAITSTQQSSTATTQAASDGTLTQSEVDELESYIAETELLIDYADELITAYYGLYGDLATETLDTLQAIEQDLSTLDSSLAAAEAVLTEVDKALASKSDVTQAALAQLKAAAQTANVNATELQTRAQDWLGKTQAAQDKRAAAALNAKPTQVAADRQAALQSAFAYVDAVRGAMTDNKISSAELTNIAQLGANASAGLKAQGGPQLQRSSDSINQITNQLARGQMPQAKSSLGSLESALGNRPSLPSRP